MARGGRRKGTPGTAYGNRTDLNKPAKPMAIPGQTYGEQARQVAAQKAMPMAPPPSASPIERLSGYAGPTPNDAPTLLTGETERPNEPLTAGLPTGPGVGPEALNMGPKIDRPGVDDLRAVYAAFPYEGIARLLRWAEK